MDTAADVTALRRFHEARYDLVLLDVIMPGIDGPEVLKEIRKTSDVPVVLCSALSPHSLDDVMSLERNVHFLSKPFPDGLLECVQNILAA